MTDFPATRAAALARLDEFLPHAGIAYARRRNYDLPGHKGVSRLSPYLRHRLITEQEVLAATLGQHSAQEAEKFIAEVCWRTYWKGVLQRRPALWALYQADLNSAWNKVQTNGGLRSEWGAACKGETGIACFDHWAQELVETGYLHNHARMWFASIWIFTLRLPWVLGADFFLRHLLDGDPASNTLSWRWVGGLQTKGKTYLATADNIAKFTEGRFRPTGLATYANPLEGPDLPPICDVPISDPLPRDGKIGHLVTEEDLSPDWITSAPVTAVARLDPQTDFGPLKTAPHVGKFKADCLADFAAQTGQDVTTISSVESGVEWAQSHALNHVILALPPTGPVGDTLAGLRVALRARKVNLSVQIKPYDSIAWTHATHGFFRFKKVIPDLTNL